MAVCASLCSDKIFMVMELVTGGELFDRVVAQGPMKAREAVWRGWGTLPGLCPRWDGPGGGGSKLAQAE